MGDSAVAAVAGVFRARCCFVWGGALWGEGLISIFHQFFAGIGGGGAWGLGYDSMGF